MVRWMVKHLLAAMGYTIARRAVERDEFPPDMDEAFIEIYKRCRDYTMTYIERMHALHNATRYVAAYEIPGAIVECGVWKGGSMMNAAYTLLSMGKTDTDLFLYDTYEGMTRPSSVDVDFRNRPAIPRWEQSRSQSLQGWCYASLEEVKQNLYSTGYPRERLHFVKGPVEETIPEQMPDRISLLRLDTDWYGSTYHELSHLFPILSRGGVILLDDYGYWRGHREAVDQYVAEHGIQILLQRIDCCGVIGIKT
jgi:O-methyltransferase